MKAIKRTAFELSERDRQRIFAEVYKDIGEQFMGMACYTLDRQYGWKTQRLKTFIEAMHDMSKMLDTMTFRDKSDAIDCIEWLKNTHGLDLEELFPMSFEIER